MHAHHVFGLRLFPFIYGSVVLEIAWYALIQKRAYPWWEMSASLGVYLLRLPMRLIAPLILAPPAYFLWSHRLTTIPLDTAWGLALLFVGEEFTYYWSHRASHEIR